MTRRLHNFWRKFIISSASGGLAEPVCVNRKNIQNKRSKISRNCYDLMDGFMSLSCILHDGKSSKTEKKFKIQILF